MVNWMHYYEIQKFKRKGFSKSKTAEKLGINRETVSVYWNMSAKEFEQSLSQQRHEKRKQIHTKTLLWNMPVYFTFDIDSIDPAFAPATGTPVVGGPSSGDVCRVLRCLEGINVVAADIVCVAPTLDSPAQTTCFVADTVVQNLMCLMAKARIERKNSQ